MMFTLLVALAELASAETRDPLRSARSTRETQSVEPEGSPPTLARPRPMEQLRNPRTGVTCTMQILRAFPADPESVRPAPSHVDPGIRGKVSPCLD
jgi:hypothetical protein